MPVINEDNRFIFLRELMEFKSYWDGLSTQEKEEIAEKLAKSKIRGTRKHRTLIKRYSGGMSNQEKEELGQKLAEANDQDNNIYRVLIWDVDLKKFSRRYIRDCTIEVGRWHVQDSYMVQELDDEIERRINEYVNEVQEASRTEAPSSKLLEESSIGASLTSDLVDVTRFSREKEFTQFNPWLKLHRRTLIKLFERRDIEQIILDGLWLLDGTTGTSNISNFGDPYALQYLFNHPDQIGGIWNDLPALTADKVDSLLTELDKVLDKENLHASQSNRFYFTWGTLLILAKLKRDGYRDRADKVNEKYREKVFRCNFKHKDNTFVTRALANLGYSTWLQFAEDHVKYGHEEHQEPINKFNEIWSFWRMRGAIETITGKKQSVAPLRYRLDGAISHSDKQLVDILKEVLKPQVTTIFLGRPSYACIIEMLDQDDCPIFLKKAWSSGQIKRL